MTDAARAAQPIMPLRLFASRERSGAYMARMLFLGAMIGFFFFTTQFLQGVYGWTSLEAGLGFLPMTAVNFAVAMAVPRLTTRVGNAALLVTGIAVTAVGMGWLSTLEPSGTYLAGIALPMVLIGIGQGLAVAPLTSAGIAGVTARDAGAASGLVNTAHQLGSALGLGILVAVAASAGSPRGAPLRSWPTTSALRSPEAQSCCHSRCPWHLRWSSPGSFPADAPKEASDDQLEPRRAEPERRRRRSEARHSPNRRHLLDLRHHVGRSCRQPALRAVGVRPRQRLVSPRPHGRTWPHPCRRDRARRQLHRRA